MIERRIEWADTDASGKYHNTAALRYVEAAETTLLDRLGIVHELYGRHPRVHISADFLESLRFRDPVEVSLTVEAVGATSVTYSFEIRSSDRVCARGRMVAVYLAGPGKTEPWPDEYRRLFEESGPQAPERLVAG